jgi:hypothetical protein
MNDMKQMRTRTAISFLAIALWASGAMQASAEAPVAGKENFKVLDHMTSPAARRGAAGVYALGKLRAAYNGPAIEVRRSSDNTTAIIGFAASGELDVDALLKFVGDGSGYVKTWYDQSGTGWEDVNLAQPTLEKQRVIVKAGKLVTFPGTQKPALAEGGPGESFCGSSKGPKVYYHHPFRAMSAVIHPTGSGYVYSALGGSSLLVDKGILLFDGVSVDAKNVIKNDMSVQDKSVVVSYVNPLDIKTNDRAAYCSGVLLGQSSVKFGGHHMQIAGNGIGPNSGSEKERNAGCGFAGYLAEIVFYVADITDEDRARLEGDQSWRFGLEKNLPENHPFKKSAPTEVETKK